MLELSLIQYLAISAFLFFAFIVISAIGLLLSNDSPAPKQYNEFTDNLSANSTNKIHK